MRILILGGAGFLGTHTVRRCLSIPDAEVTVLDSLEFLPGHLPQNSKSVWDRITYIRGSICNSKLLKDLAPSQDIIFHCAAQSSHTQSIQDPLRDAEINIEGTLKVLEALRHYNRNCVLIYPSSTSVIGKSEESVIDESHPLRPLDIYSIHKAACEQYIETYHRLYRLKTVSLRFGNLYGAFGKPEPEFGFINHFIAQAFANDTLKIFGRGTQMRNIMHGQDAADLMIRAAFTPELLGQTWMATSPFHLPIIDIAASIVRVFQSGKIVHVPWPEDRAAIEIGSVFFSSSALRKKIQWDQDTDFENGLQKTRAMMEASPKNIFS